MRIVALSIVIIPGSFSPIPFILYAMLNATTPVVLCTDVVRFSMVAFAFAITTGLKYTTTMLSALASIRFAITVMLFAITIIAGSILVVARGMSAMVGSSVK